MKKKIISSHQRIARWWLLFQNVRHGEGSLRTPSLLVGENVCTIVNRVLHFSMGAIFRLEAGGARRKRQMTTGEVPIDAPSNGDRFGMIFVGVRHVDGVGKGLSSIFEISKSFGDAASARRCGQTTMGRVPIDAKFDGAREGVFGFLTQRTHHHEAGRLSFFEFFKNPTIGRQRVQTMGEGYQKNSGNVHNLIAHRLVPWKKICDERAMSGRWKIQKRKKRKNEKRSTDDDGDGEKIRRRHKWNGNDLAKKMAPFVKIPNNFQGSLLA
jgi:hypothetical protein